MKKKIFNYDQLKLMNSGLDTDELIILDYISHFKNSGKMTECVKDGKAWNWISWNKIATDLPFLRIKKDAIQRKCLYYLGVKPTDWDEKNDERSESTLKKFKNYKFLGLLEFDTIGKKGEEKTIFRFTQKWYDLISEDGETGDNDSNDNKKDLSAPTDKPSSNKNLKRNVKNSIAENTDDVQEENNEKLNFIKEQGIIVPKNTSEDLKNEVKSWDMDLLLKCTEYMYFNKSNIDKFNINYLAAIYRNPKFITKEVKPEVNKQELPTVKTRFHNINSTFNKYTPEELEIILFESQKDKFK